MNDLDIGNDFARELAEGMAALMRDIAAETVKEEREGAESTLTSEEEQRREAEFKKAWEQMLVNGMNGMSGMKDPHDGSQSEEGAADDRFQSAIQDTMKKLKIAEDAEVRVFWLTGCSFPTDLVHRPNRSSQKTKTRCSRSSSRSSVRAAQSQMMISTVF